MGRSVMRSGVDMEAVGNPNEMRRLFAPDALLPSQYADLMRQTGELAPERKLMLALLEGCLDDLARTARVTRLRGALTKTTSEDNPNRIRQEQIDWVLSEDRDQTAFLTVCEVLNFEPEYIRRGLKNCDYCPIWTGPSRRMARRTGQISGRQFKVRSAESTVRRNVKRREERAEERAKRMLNDNPGMAGTYDEVMREMSDEVA